MTESTLVTWTRYYRAHGGPSDRAHPGGLLVGGGGVDEGDEASLATRERASLASRREEHVSEGEGK